MDLIFKLVGFLFGVFGIVAMLGGCFILLNHFKNLFTNKE